MEHGEKDDPTTSAGVDATPSTSMFSAIPQAALDLPQDLRASVATRAVQSSAEAADDSIEALATWLDQYAVGDSKVFVKLLITNAAAGSIIGRGGSMVTTLQRDTRTRVQLSRSGEYFPGTMDRVLLIVGRRRNIVTALEAVLVKLMCEKVAPLHPHSAVKSGAAALLNLRMLVPAAVTGTITDSNGVALSVFREQTRADVLVMLDNLPCANIMYRQVVVIGTVAQQLKALTLLLGHLDSDPQYAMYCDTPPPMPQPPSSRGRGKAAAGVGGLPPAFVQQQLTPGLSGFAAADLPVSAAPFIPTAAAPHGAGLVAGHAHMLAPPPTTTGAAVASLTHPSGSAAAAAGGGAVETFRMDITREQANMLLSAAGQQLIQYVQQTSMTSVQLLPAGLDGVSGPAIVLQGPRELAEVAQWMLLQGLMPVGVPFG